MENSTQASNGVVDQFVRYFASLDATQRTQLLARVNLRAAAEAPPEAFERPSIGRSAADLIRETPEDPDWLIPSVLARGWMIKIAAREKTGKGTLIAYLLGCLEREEASIFGAAGDATTALIYTEEPPESIREKAERAGLERAWIVYGWELAQLTSWEAKVDRLVADAVEGEHGVLFVDNISRAASIEEEAGVELARAAEYLGEQAKAAGLTVILDHHHKKGAGKLDDKSRGGTALAGACDSNIEMQRIGDWDSRVRKLSSRGRLSVTVWEQTIALSEDGRSYECVAGATQPQNSRDRQRLRILDEAGDAGVTALGFAKAADIGDSTARRVLDEFVAKGWATEDGARPARWRATGEGLDGFVDLLEGEPWAQEGVE